MRNKPNVPPSSHEWWTHWVVRGLNKMADIVQKTSWNAYPWMLRFEFWTKFHKKMFCKGFIDDESTLVQQLMAWWCQKTSHYQNNCCLKSMKPYAPRGNNELICPPHACYNSITHKLHLDKEIKQCCNVFMTQLIKIIFIDFAAAAEYILTHWGLVTPHGAGDLGQHWFR